MRNGTVSVDETTVPVVFVLARIGGCGEPNAPGGVR